MCRMAAIITKNIKHIEDYIFLQFFNLAIFGRTKPYRQEGHLDGWGVAGLLGNKPTVFYKSVTPIIKDTKNYFNTIDKLKKSNSKISIIHFRKSSSGTVKLENTHPFIYDDWIFAHNGTILDKNKLELNKLKPQGDTDSEVLFYYMIENFGNKINFIPLLVDILRYIKTKLKHTSLTFLLATPEYLVAYREYSTKFAEENDNVLWNKNYYTLFYAKTRNYIIFCSEPIDSVFHKWVPMSNSHLVVVNKYLDIVFSRKI